MPKNEIDIKAREYVLKREEELSRKTGTMFQYSGYEVNLIIQSYIAGATNEGS